MIIAPLILNAGQGNAGEGAARMPEVPAAQALNLREARLRISGREGGFSSRPDCPGLIDEQPFLIPGVLVDDLVQRQLGRSAAVAAERLRGHGAIPSRSDQPRAFASASATGP